MIPFLPYSIMGGIQKSFYDTLLLVRPFKMACARLPSCHLPTVHLLLVGNNCRNRCSVLAHPVGHTAAQLITAVSLNTQMITGWIELDVHRVEAKTINSQSVQKCCLNSVLWIAAKERELWINRYNLSWRICFNSVYHLRLVTSLGIIEGLQPH